MILENQTLRMTEEQYKRNIEKLQEYVKKYELTKRDLAKCIKSSDCTVGELLNGKRIGSVDLWERIEEYTELKFEYERKAKKRIKKKVKKSIIPEYIEKMLAGCGKTVISSKRLKKYGKQRIIDELKQRGFNVIIYRTENDNDIVEILQE